jgi:hypothetical protein
LRALHAGSQLRLPLALAVLGFDLGRLAGDQAAERHANDAGDAAISGAGMSAQALDLELRKSDGEGVISIHAVRMIPRITHGNASDRGF